MMSEEELPQLIQDQRDMFANEARRLRAIINEQSDAHVAHVKGLHEKWEAERKILVNEVEKLREALAIERRRTYEEAVEDIERLRAAILEKETVMKIRAAAVALKETGE